MIYHYKTFKVCLLADKSAGKKMLANYARESGISRTGLTLGVEFLHKNVVTYGNQKIVLRLY
jgi:hypothetical protein